MWQLHYAQIISDGDAYVSKVKQTTQKLVEEGFLLSKDAARMIAEAEKADVP
jgi:hypothetical protein